MNADFAAHRLLLDARDGKGLGRWLVLGPEPGTDIGRTLLAWETFVRRDDAGSVGVLDVCAVNVALFV